MRPFEPLFKNPHLATIAGNFWSRPESESRWPVSDVFYEPEPGVKLLVRTTRRLALNDDGREFFARCQRILNEIEDAESAVRGARETGAIKAISTIHAAQVQYYSNYGRYATTLQELGPPANGSAVKVRARTRRARSWRTRALRSRSARTYWTPCWAMTIDVTV